MSIGEDPNASYLDFAWVGGDVHAERGVARIADGDIDRPIWEGVEAAEELVLEGSS